MSNFVILFLENFKHILYKIFFWQDKVSSTSVETEATKMSKTARVSHLTTIPEETSMFIKEQIQKKTKPSMFATSHASMFNHSIH